MRQTGADMQSKDKKTSLGGLAVNTIERLEQIQGLLDQRPRFGPGRNSLGRYCWTCVRGR